MNRTDIQLPYLSLVLTGRNDNYGGDFRSRLQACVSNAFRQLTEYRIRSEIIFVNYNPVADNPPIEEFIDWPRSTGDVKVRIITVSNEIHQDLVRDGTRKDVPVLEYLGKNAGIRRATGEFILSMNPDIILPAGVVRELVDLRSDTYYRADRIDFEEDPDGRHRLLRLFLKGDDYAIRHRWQIIPRRIRNFFRIKWRLLTPHLSPLLNRYSVMVYYHNRECRYHCNVSGDFMLMHRSHWNALNGHAEHPSIALHVDSLTVIQAAFLPLREHTFLSPVFHREHARRYDATKTDPDIVRAWDMYCGEADEMEQTGTSRIYNDAYWGLSKFDLPEINP